MCDREIETAREGEIVLKAETTQPERKREGWVGGGGNKASDSATQGETFV